MRVAAFVLINLHPQQIVLTQPPRKVETVAERRGSGRISGMEYPHNHPYWGELTVRAFNVISNATGGYNERPTWTLDDLCKFSAREMLRWPNAGEKTVREIEAFVASHGRQLAELLRDEADPVEVFEVFSPK
jgi:DNA-directed RNA polymerase alpha subunit